MTFNQVKFSVVEIPFYIWNYFNQIRSSKALENEEKLIYFLLIWKAEKRVGGEVRDLLTAGSFPKYPQ